MASEERTTSSTGGQKGVKLARFDLIPAGPLQKLAEHFGKGAKKYAEHQWRDGYEWSKSYSAMCRHQNEFWAGRDYDVCSNEPDNCAIKTDDGHVIKFHAFDAKWFANDGFPDEVQIKDRRYRTEHVYEHDTCYNHTGSHHLDCVMWHSFVLREFVEIHPDHDDRYIPEAKIDLNEVAYNLGFIEKPWTGLPVVPYFMPRKRPHTHFTIDGDGNVSTDF